VPLSCSRACRAQPGLPRPPNRAARLFERLSCHALKITKVAAGVGASVKIAGVRYDLKLGRANTISIKPKAKSAGKKSKKPKKGKVCS
jgi:hypothetical protein